MKTLLNIALLIAGLAFASLANATTHVVTVQNDSFTPSSFTATVGDTVEWEWVAGSHTTSSQAGIPAGAASWNNPMNSSSTTFKYKITVAGTYNYQCNIHFACCGMAGSFTVTAPAGVPVVSNSSQPIAKIFPNPVVNVLNIHLNSNLGNNVLIINDILGKEVLRETLYNSDNTINVSGWKSGIYFYRLKGDMEEIEGKLEVE